MASALMAVGLVMVASTSASLDHSLFALPFWENTPGRHALFVLCGFAVMLVTSFIAGRALRTPSLRRGVTLVLVVVTAGCLVAALLPGLGDAHRGSHRWLRVPLGGMELGYQPSELAKLALVALLASLLADGGMWDRLSSLSDRLGRQVGLQGRSHTRRRFVPAALSIGVCVLLVGVEDFGTAVLLACVGVSMLFVAGCRLRDLAVLGGLGLVGLTGLLYAAPYRLERLAAYTDFWSDPQGKGYQPIQSLATIASGGWLGTGLGSGVQKYGYLPESHTDFIFAVICEEMGLLGAGLVIVLFGAFVWLGIRVMLAARTRFEQLVAFGLTMTLGLQAVMNIAVVTVAAPTTGISLPLVSAGGSGLLTFCLLAGVLAAIARRGSLCREGEQGSMLDHRRRWFG